MMQYYFESLPGEQGDGGVSRLFVVIEKQYYWTMTWKGDTSSPDAEIEDFTAGFVTAEITKQIDRLKELGPMEVREQFGSFSYYVERAVSGFKSYIAWISPDPQTSHVSWKIPLN